MTPLQPDRGADDQRGGLRLRVGTAGVVMGETGLPAIAKAAPQLPHGVERLVEILGNRFEGLALLVALHDQLPDGLGYGTWHGAPSFGAKTAGREMPAFRVCYRCHGVYPPVAACRGQPSVG